MTASTVPETASDGEDDVSQSVTVTVNRATQPPVNRPPVAAGTISNRALTLVTSPSASFSVASSFSDPDGDRLTYRASSSNTSRVTASMSGSALIVTAVSQGAATVTVTATDPGNLSATQQFTVTVPNRSPVVSKDIPDQTLTAGGSSATFDLDSYFSDPDGDRLTYRSSLALTRIARARVSGSTLTITPVSAGNATLNVFAEDRSGLASQSVTVTVGTAAGLSASIDGPSSITTFGGKTWTASVSGGAAPYMYGWRYSALQIPPYAATFEALRDRYAAADRSSNNGAYATTIEDRFAERRIGGPAMPGMPSITVDSQTRNAKITWRDNSLIEGGYRIERRYNHGAWSVIANLDAGAEAYTDTSYQCISGQSGSKNTYSYRIVPYKDYDPGIGIVTTESATITLSMANCQMAPASRIADASAEVEMISDARIQVEQRKVPTGLEAPHPNPFNPATTIRYGLAEEGPVRLTVYDLLGRRVAVLLDGVQTPGKHTVRFEASRLSSGLYIVILDAGGKTFTKSVMLMK